MASLTPPEALQAGKAGEPAGFMGNLGTEISKRIHEAGMNAFSAKLGVEKTLKRLEGIKDARPNIIDLAAGAIDLVGTGFDIASQQYFSWAGQREQRALGHEAALPASEAKRQGASFQQRQEGVSTAVSEALDLPARVPTEKDYKPTGKEQRAEKHHKFWKDVDNFRAGKDLEWATGFDTASRALREAADKMRDVTGRESRIEAATLAAQSAQTDQEKIAAINATLENQFKAVTTTGRDVAAEARGATMGTPNRKEQDKIVGVATQKISKLGTN